MPDSRKWTNDQLEKLEKELYNIYNEAGVGLTLKAREFLADMQRMDEVRRKQVKDGEWTEEQYKEWRKNKLLYFGKYKRLMETVQREMLEVNKKAIEILNGETPKIFAHNYNSIVESFPDSPVEGFTFELVDAETVKRLATSGELMLPPKKDFDPKKDAAWNGKQVNAQILQGILQGESIPKIAARMADVCESNHVAMVRTARTIVTAAENSGRLAGMNKAEEGGMIFEKIWMAATDARTRDSHLDLNGKKVKNGEKFKSITGAELEFPGDWRAPGYEVYNCRCSLGTHYIGFKKGVLSEKIKKEKEERKARETAEAPKNNIREIPQMPKRPKASNFATDEEYQTAKLKYREERDKCNAILDRYLQEDLNRPRKYKTKKDVLEWCKANNVRIDDNVLDIIDIRVWDDVITVQEEMFKRFPKVKELQDKLYPYGFSYEEGYSKEYLFSATRGLYFGDSWKDYEWALRSSVLDRMSTGYLNNGDGTLKTVLRHEFGHNMEHLIKEQFSTLELRGDDPRAKERMKIRRKYESELIELTDKYCKTEYAYTNTGEAFAEGFAEFTSNPDSEYGKAFAEFFERWYKG